jgi:hypothetical protein
MAPPGTFEAANEAAAERRIQGDDVSRRRSRCLQPTPQA